MASRYQQDTRFCELTTPLGPDRLVLMSFSGSEGISELFEFRINALCEQEADEDLDFDTALGKNCTVRVTTDNQGDRFFVGTLAEAQRLGPTDGGVLYRLILRPWFWMLTKRVNSRVFHEMAVDAIIREVFADHGFANFELRTTKSYPDLEYCVQHQESDFAFVCRLMERFGISYYFTFASDDQKLILADDRSGYGDAPGKARNFYEETDGNQPREEYLSQWIQERRFTTGKLALTDYNFKKPGTNLPVDKLGDAKYEPGDIEHYDHPGGYDEESNGNPLAESGVNAFRAADGRYLAAGTCASFAPGNVFDLEGHHDADEYLILRCSHSFSPADFRSVAGASSGDPYRGNYEFLKAAKPFAPPRVTPRPFIAGPQTGKVVGDEEVDCDEYGRIKVRLHWSRKDGGPELETMRCRVAQVWAGSDWGGIFIPRRDMEVLVQFIDGDPDRPIVVGCVYNEDNLPPYPLPSENFTAGWKSQTIGGGGYNEIALVDDSGNELVRIVGEKDIEGTAKNDITLTADHMITLQVGESKIVMDQTSITLTSMSIKIEASADLTTNGKAMATHESGGMMTISAAIVKVN